MFMRKPTHRIFDYEPRYYSPSEDKDEKLKRRLGFSRKKKSISKKGGLSKSIILAILIIICYLILSGIL